MKDTHSIKPVYSVLSTVTAITTTLAGAIIDKLGFDTIQAFVGCDQLPLDGVIDWKIRHASDAAGSDIADISGAVGNSMIVTDDTIVANVDLVDGAQTIAAQPANPSRLRIEVTDTTPSITVGNVVIVGYGVIPVPPGLHQAEDKKVQAITETVAFTAGAIKTTTAIFSSITSITTDSFATLAGGSDEKIEVGVDNSTGVHIGHLDGIHTKRYIQLYLFNVVGASGNVFGGFNMYHEKRQPTVGEFGQREFGYYE